MNKQQIKERMEKLNEISQYYYFRDYKDLCSRKKIAVRSMYQSGEY